MTEELKNIIINTSRMWTRIYKEHEKESSYFTMNKMINLLKSKIDND